MSKLNRRKLLKLGAAGSLITFGGVLSACAPRRTAPATTSTRSTSTANGTAFVPDLEIALKAVAGETAILPGSRTRVWRYEAQVTKGEPNSVVTLPDNYLGPIIKIRTGQKVRVNFANALPEGQPTIVHWHGLTLPEEMDGHPRYQIQPGQTYLYEFEVKNRAGTYWFHPHPHGFTPLQVNNGLAGLFLVSDEEESSAGLPSGEQDIPIIIQDRTFDADNQFVYNIAMNGMGGGMMGGGMMGNMNNGGNMQGMMSSVMGFLGERILVNGKPDYRLSVATRAYRLRLLNGSNSRIYKLAWSDGTPMTIIATDGGLLDKPAKRNFVMLAPGERVELWANFSERKVGDEFTLESQAFESGETTMGNGGMGMGMTNGNAPGLGAGMTILSVRVERQATETLKMPAQLSTVKRLSVDEAVNASSPRQFHLTLNGMQWLINGRTFEMNAVADDELVKIGTTEVWEFLNEKNAGQMMDPNGMPHPFHIHGVQFNVIERTALSDLQPMVDAVRDGYVDDGWKDTFLLMPGERVKVLTRFTNTGTFVFHCHNLEHEAQGMMRNYRVVA